MCSLLQVQWRILRSVKLLRHPPNLQVDRECQLQYLLEMNGLLHRQVCQGDAEGRCCLRVMNLQFAAGNHRNRSIFLRQAPPICCAIFRIRSAAISTSLAR